MKCSIGSEPARIAESSIAPDYPEMKFAPNLRGINIGLVFAN
jgi:hypothetical protein